MIICPNVPTKRCMGDDAEIWLNGAHLCEDLPDLHNFIMDNVHPGTQGTQCLCAEYVTVTLLLCATTEILVC